MNVFFFLGAEVACQKPFSGKLGKHILFKKGAVKIENVRFADKDRGKDKVIV